MIKLPEPIIIPKQKEKLSEYDKTKWTIIGVATGLSIEAILLWYLTKLDLWECPKDYNIIHLTGNIVCQVRADDTLYPTDAEVCAFNYNGKFGGFRTYSGRYAHRQTGQWQMDVKAYKDKVTEYELMYLTKGFSPVGSGIPDNGQITTITIKIPPMPDKSSYSVGTQSFDNTVCPSCQVVS